MCNEEILQQLNQEPNDDTRRELMAQLYTQNIGLIQRFSQPYINAGMEAEDALQEAYIALHEAVTRYDPNGGASFSTYLVQWIRATVGRQYTETEYIKRIPAYMQDRIYKYNKLREGYFQATGREPTEAYIRRKLDLSEKQVQAIRQTIREAAPLSFNELIPGAEKGGLTYEETIPDARDMITDLCDDLSAQQDAARLWEQVEALEDTQTQVIKTRYQEGQTVTATAERLGIGRSRVQTAEYKALYRLRRNKTVKQIAEDRRYLRYAYKGGTNRFKNSGASIVEWITIKRLDRREEDDAPAN